MKMTLAFWKNTTNWGYKPVSFDTDEESTQSEKEPRPKTLRSSQHATFLIVLASLLIVAALAFRIGVVIGQQDNQNNLNMHGLLGQCQPSGFEAQSC